MISRKRPALALVVGIIAWLNLALASESTHHASQTERFSAVEVAPDAGSSDWTPVDLPHRWDLNGTVDAGTLWYRAFLHIESPMERSLSLYIPKVSMTADIWLNGRPVADQENGSQTLPRHWNTPLLFGLPPGLLHAGRNELMIRVRAQGRHDGGLSPFFVGETQTLQITARKAAFWRNTFVGVSVTCVLALGFVVGIIWARWRSRAEYGYFALGALGCGVSSLNMIVVEPPMSDAVWELVVHGALHAGVLSLALFAWQLSGKSTRVSRWVVLAIIVIDLCAMALFGESEHRTIVSFISLVVFITAAAALVPLVRYLLHQPLVDLLVFGFAALLAVAIGGYDWLKVSGLLPYEWPFALPYVWPALLGAFGWLVAGDYARTQRDLAALNQELSDRVHARELVLEDTYNRLRRAEQAEAVAQERARILRDMHDGVGSHLSAAVRQLESGGGPVESVTHTLRDALDHLKLSIDGMSMPAGDVNALLAGMRYRMERRLRDAGLQVHWAVDELPFWPDGTRERFMQHLQYVLFELISNVLQHAQARNIEVTAGIRGNQLELSVSDDGQGMPAATPLRSAAARASVIGAALEVEAREAGTRVVLRLNLASGPCAG